MAELLLWSDWSSGKSDDEYIWPWDPFSSFKTSKNLEIENIGRLTLTKSSKKKSWSTVDQKVIQMMPFPYSGSDYIYAFWTWNDVYSSKDNWGSWELKYSWTLWWVNWAALFNWFLYLFNGYNCYEITWNNAENNFIDWNISALSTSFTNIHSWLYPSIVWNDTLYVWNWSNIVQIDATWPSATLTADALSLKQYDRVRAITAVWAYLKIYTTTQENLWGRIYFWDWVADSWNELVEWERLPIWAAKNSGNFDYVIAWFKPKLYVASWYEKNLITTFPSYIEWSVWEIAEDAIDILSNRAVIWVPNDNVYNDNVWIWSYWSKTELYPKAVSFRNLLSSSTATNVYSVLSHKDLTLIAWYNWTSYWIDKVSVNTYNTTWEVESLIFQWGLAHKIKTIQSIHLWCNTLRTWEKIEIFLSRDWASFSSTADLTMVYTDTADRDLQFKRVDTPIWDFNILNIKIKLTWEWTTTPEVREIGVLWDYVYNN